MVGIELIVPVALAVAAAVLATAFFSIWIFERRRHRKLISAHVALSRGLSTYQRASLSAEWNNYQHIGPPANALRSSVNFSNNDPYPDGEPPTGAVGQSFTPWEVQQGDEYGDPASAKRRKSLRQRLHPYPLSNPKTRRQRKIQKTIAMNPVPRSPLSAITEFTDTTPSETVTPIAPFDPPVQCIPAFYAAPASSPVEDRSASPQWPLSDAGSSAHGAPKIEQSAFAARESILIRAGGQRHPHAPAHRSMGLRSLSSLSCTTEAPAEDLPPLPSFKARTREGLRLSNTSVDTVGSSVLDETNSSPRGQLNRSMPIFQIDLHSPGLHAFDSSNAFEPCALTMGEAAAKPTTFDSRMPELESVHLSGGLGFSSRDTKQRPQPQGLFQTTIRGSSENAKSCSAQHKDVTWRHSMFAGSLLSPCGDDSNVLKPHWRRKGIPKRPASVAIGNPFNWNQQGGSDVQRGSSLRKISGRDGETSEDRLVGCLNSEPSTRKRKLTCMVEEAYASDMSVPRPLTRHRSDKIEAAILRPRTSTVDVKGSPSPLDNRPILRPTSQNQLPGCRRVSSYGSSGTPRPDSDVFCNADLEGALFGRTSLSQQWPLSPTPKHHIKLNSTPPAPRQVAEVYEHDSPMLPSPARTAASLFPRKSLIRGPRDLPPSGHSSRTASPSPAGAKAYKGIGDDLRKSVMVLRRMTSEGKLMDRNSRIYRNIRESPSDFSTLNILASPETSSFNLAEPALGQSDASKSLAPNRNSRMSLGAGSIWEDVSVRGDSPEPEVPGSGKPMYLFPDPEARENFNPAPQGKGLGLAIFHTPRSLYDRDGFLKDF